MATAIKTRNQKYHQSESAVASGRKMPAKSGVRVKKVSGEHTLLLLIAAVIFVVGILYVGTQNIVMEKGFEIGELKEEIGVLNDDIGHLNLTISELKAPERIESIALENLGMIKATQDDMVYYQSVNAIGGTEEEESAAVETQEEAGFFDMVRQLFQRE